MLIFTTTENLVVLQMSNIHSLLTTGTFKGSRQNAVRCGTAGGPIKAAL